MERDKLILLILVIVVVCIIIAYSLLSKRKNRKHGKDPYDHDDCCGCGECEDGDGALTFPSSCPGQVVFDSEYSEAFDINDECGCNLLSGPNPCGLGCGIFGSEAFDQGVNSWGMSWVVSGAVNPQTYYMIEWDLVDLTIPNSTTTEQRWIMSQAEYDLHGGFGGNFSPDLPIYSDSGNSLDPSVFSFDVGIPANITSATETINLTTGNIDIDLEWDPVPGATMYLVASRVPVGIQSNNPNYLSFDNYGGTSVAGTATTFEMAWPEGEEDDAPQWPELQGEFEHRVIAINDCADNGDTIVGEDVFIFN